MAEDTTDMMTPEELKKLQQEIDEANKKIVSKEVQDRIEQERKKAKEEAEKEFLTNQRIKELEKEKEELAKKQQEIEMENARKLEELTKKVNDSISSRAAKSQDNPFAGSSNNGPMSILDSINENNIDDIERRSFEMFVNRKRE